MTKNNLIITVVFVVFVSISGLAAAAPVLKLGMDGKDVLALQSKLKELGYYTGEPDGSFGAETHAAVVNFQLDMGLEPDGAVGERTLQTLQAFPSTGGTVSRGLADSRKGQRIVSLAKRFLGVPYAWAGRSPEGFDCSGFIQYIFNQYSIPLPRMADEQFEIGIAVPQNDLQPGDLVFFSTYEPGPSHVGIYMGEGQFIHASSGADEVTITPIGKDYYRERYVGARRVLK
ncbi:MAG: NlpC/P60 family protein [Negativicutes bacterium]|nr:NlpC/P60 family protein [Negativicutes bacterium]